MDPAKADQEQFLGGLNISPAESPKPHSNVGLFMGWGHFTVVSCRPIYQLVLCR